MEYKYQGIILGKYDVAEVDRIYSIYTKEAGKIRVLGKGTRNPNAKLAGSLEPLTSVELFISRTRGLGKITGVIVADNFSRIKADWSIMARVFYIFGILDRIITQEEKDERIFGLVLQYLETLEKGSGTFFAAKKVPDPINHSEEKMDVLTLGFLFKLLGLLGYGLNMENCVRCGSRLAPEKNYFSAASGGVFCQKCSGTTNTKIGINSATIKLIRLFEKNKIESLVKLSVSQDDIRNAKAIAGEMVKWIIG